MGKMQNHLKKVSTKTPIRTWVNREHRRFTFLPKRMTSGKLIWWNWYYCYEELRNVDPRHMWIREINYSEEEYFLHRLANDI